MLPLKLDIKDAPRAGWRVGIRQVRMREIWIFRHNRNFSRWQAL